MLTLYTIGHSTRSLAEFISVLQSHGITLLVDVRTVPRSRTNPQFNRETLPAALAEAGIAYEHRADLGGLRKARADSPNTGWRNLSFRGYADYMQTPQFAAALQGLIVTAAQHRTAVMCAESVPWRCHRSLIADAFVAAGHHAVHLMSPGRADPHKLTSFAVITGGHVSYPDVDATL
jgi:uncharacterized protein (DUF488 family)